MKLLEHHWLGSEFRSWMNCASLLVLINSRSNKNMNLSPWKNWILTCIRDIFLSKLRSILRYLTFRSATDSLETPEMYKWEKENLVFYTLCINSLSTKTKFIKPALNIKLPFCTILILFDTAATICSLSHILGF